MDISIKDEGTILLINFISDRAINWAEENISDEDSTWYGSELVVEHRFFEHLLYGLKDARFKIEEI